MKSRTELINYIIQERGFTSYLEIGVQNRGNNFDLVECKFKIGVDPAPSAKASFTGTSNEYFKENRQSFDLVFIDGLHHYDQVLVDIVSANSVLNDGGVIILHDTNPNEKRITAVPRVERGRWTGDVFRVLNNLRPLSDYRTPDIDPCGITVIKELVLGNPGDLTYEEFDADRKSLLNLCTIDEFKQWL